MGGAATLLGLGSIFAESKFIYLGALIVGPIIIFRGVHLLHAVNEYYAQNPHLDMAASSNADATRVLALSPKSIRIEVKCESCKTAYVYFPERDETALEQFSTHGESAAPCPKCGWVQSFMFPVASQFVARPIVVATLKYAAALAFFGSAITLVVTMSSFYGGSKDKNPESEPYYWGVLGLLLLTGAICGIAWLVQKRGNPNSAPLALRLAVGSKLGMPLETFQAMTNSEAGKPKQGPSTEGGQVPTTESSDGDKSQTGIKENTGM
jgi:hypothetical protein